MEMVEEQSDSDSGILSIIFAILYDFILTGKKPKTVSISIVELKVPFSIGEDKRRKKTPK
jgi:hypothetical protein